MNADKRKDKSKDRKEKMSKKEKLIKQIKRSGPHILLTFLLLLILSAIIIIALCNFYIIRTTKPESVLEKLSSIASWASISLSVVAIVVATWVPLKIAARQDKISLFEKRYECLVTYNVCKAFVGILDTITEKSQTSGAFYQTFKLSVFDEPPSAPLANYSSLWKVQKTVAHQIMSSSYLFDGEVRNHLQSVSKSLLELLYSSHDQNDSWENEKNNYIGLFSNGKYEKIKESIEDYLNLV